MNTPAPVPDADFDAYAARYDEALHRGVSLSGERKEYFAEARIAWLSRRAGVSARFDTIMDFGCGTGSGLPGLYRQLAPRRLLGVDVSQASLDEARRAHGALPAQFLRPQDGPPAAPVQLVFSNGTFHHISPTERPGVLAYLHASLAPGGTLAIWENNPWNPGTRLVMSRIPFDRDAMPVSAPTLARLVRGAGFTVLHVDYLFIFPAFLKALRGLEPHLTRLPLGAQYLVLARKSGI
ncbi:MAG: class I SAM-dependent methyltransferase [Verrucomicrobia bacterium]|nr:class I SAM-dependent methyltransferase [Verrucomicrobiota bacterium]